MANWWEGVTHTLEIAFDSDPLEDPVWTNVSAYFRGPATTQRGTTSLDVEPSPGTFEFVLDNRDRRFDPTNTAGPYYGKLKPMRRVRWSIEIEGTSATVFTGFVTSWQQAWGPLDGTAHLVAVEGFATIARYQLPGSAYEAEVTDDSPVGYWRLQGDGAPLTGSASMTFGARQNFDPYPNAIYGAWTTADAAAPVGAAQAMGTVDGLAVATIPGLSPVETIEFWVTLGDLEAFTVQAATSTTTVFRLRSDVDGALWLSYSNVAANRCTSAGAVPVAYTIPTNRQLHIVAKRDGSTITVFVNGSIVDTVALITGTREIEIAAFEGGIPGVGVSLYPQPVLGDKTASTVSHVAIYTYSLSATRVRDHYEVAMRAWSGAHGAYGWETDGQRINRALDDAGFPAGLRDIVTGSVRQAPYLPAGRPVLEYVREVAASGAGLLFFDVDGRLCYRDREWNWVYSHPTGDELEWDGDPLEWGTAPLDWGAGPIVFADDDTGVTYLAGNPAASDVETVRNVVTVAYERGGITRRDQASIAEYGGEYPETVTARTIGIATDAANLAAYRVRVSKDPADTFPEIVVSLRDGDPEIQFAGVMSAEIGRVAEVKRTPMSVGSSVTRYGMVLGVQHEVDGVDWVSTLYLTAAPTSAEDAGYGIVGAGVVGASTVVPY